MKSRGIRFRTTALISASFILFVSVFFVVSYISVRRSLEIRSEGEMRELVETVVRELPPGQPTSAQFDSVCRNVGGTSESSLALSANKKEWKHPLVYAPHHKLFIRSVLDSFSIGGRESVIPETAVPGYRILHYYENDVEVIVAFDLTIPHEIEESMITVFLPMVGIGFVASILLSYFLSTLSLKPVTDLLTAARRIRDPHRTPTSRLPVKQIQVREIRELAEAINAVLDERAESIKSLRTFTDDAAHELRTPLTAMKGELEVELRSSSISLEERETLGSLLEEVERLISIVQDLLYLARFEGNIETGDAGEKWPLAHMLRVLTERFSSIAIQKAQSIHLQTEITAQCGLPQLHIERMLENVLLNALQYSPRGSEVVISTNVVGAVVELSIHDNGVGITSGDIEHVFDRFWRADHSRNRTSGGSGLGLSITKSVADRYGIKIRIESIVDKGTTFTFSIPAVS